jgi:hypothetical protein
MTPEEKEAQQKKLDALKEKYEKKLTDQKEKLEKKLADQKTAHEKALKDSSAAWQTKFDKAQKESDEKLEKANEGRADYEAYLAAIKKKEDKELKDHMKRFVMGRDLVYNKETKVKEFKHTNDSLLGVYTHTVKHDDLLLHAFIDHNTMKDVYVPADPAINAAIAANHNTGRRMRIVYIEDDKTDNERFNVFFVD